MKLRQLFAHDHMVLFTVMLLATGLFVFHASTILSRYLAYSVSESVYTVRNRSLVMPVVHMQLESQRGIPIPNDTVFHNMTFRAVLDDQIVPDWASPIKHDRTISHSTEVGLDSITVNRVSLDVSFQLNYRQFR